MKERLLKALKIAWVLAAVVLGIVGYMQAFACNFWRSVYCTMMMFVLSPGVGVDEMSPIILVASVMAAISTAGFVLTMLKVVREHMEVWGWKLRAKAKDRVSIHTDCAEELTPLLLDMKREKKKYIISDADASFKDGKQLFYFSKLETMLEYMLAHSDVITEDAGVYVYCEERDRDAYPGKGINNICLSENAARMYWQEHLIKDKYANIAIVGFGNYGEALLERALYMNVMATDSEITYHVFPLSQQENTRLQDFLAMHSEITHFITINERKPKMDAILTYDDMIYKHEDVLVKSRIILAADEDETNLAILSNLEKAYPLSADGMEPIAIRLETRELFNMMVKNDRNTLDGGRKDSTKEQNYPEVYLWGDKDTCMTYDIIFAGKLTRNAKIRDAYYKTFKKLEQGYPEIIKKYHLTKEQVDGMTVFEKVDSIWYQEIWNDLSLHMKGTNMALADHTAYKLWLMDPEGKIKHPSEIRGVFDSLSEERKDELAEIEHIRWLRFHYMNNWRNGDEKNFDLRTHPMLVTYQGMKDMFCDPNDAEHDKQLKEELNVMIHYDMDSYPDLGSYLE